MSHFYIIKCQYLTKTYPHITFCLIGKEILQLVVFSWCAVTIQFYDKQIN